MTAFGRKAFVCLGIAAALSAGCDARRAVMKRIVGDLSNYFQEPGAQGDAEIEKLTDRVYTFRWTWYRNIAVRTDDGWVVDDPFSVEAGRLLAAELERIAPGLPVHTLIYTHYHLDHAMGGAPLRPGRVIAHEKCPQYWEAAGARDVLPPTELIAGDRTLEIGGVRIDLLYAGLSHSDTLYAIHLPGERLLHTADMGLVRAVPPVGVPDRYGPGYEAALERLADLEFDRFVPSHFRHGFKQDLRDSIAFLKDARRLARASLRPDGHLGRTRPELEEGFARVYDGMKEKYGDWHGWNEMMFMMIVRANAGELLGY
ncbi:MAG: MBL fold metallo-hydrolase [Candidatus Methylomirabilis sp.]|nr:MBL fold metallo-hydrolase [Deltaproteobacteria bacterium]